MDTNSIQSLYLHIPFCNYLCHYCDFKKTANFSEAITAKYFERLKDETKDWLQIYKPKLKTLFFGGGTPGLFTKEIAELIEVAAPYFDDIPEITLESNPENILPEKLQSWKSAGVNRLSIGVQTFSEDGLTFLTRQHSSKQALDAIARAMKTFANVNIDLIYGWTNQSYASWEADLAKVRALNIPHVSLYTLTYEPRTPIGRRAKRGMIVPAADEKLESLYQTAMSHLADAGFAHEEVSNWAKPGFSCLHNWTYWNYQNFIGVGIGAHGYVPSEEPLGMYYSDQRSLRAYLESEGPARNHVITEPRQKEEVLLEILGTSTRTHKGVDIRRIEKDTAMTYRASAFIERGIKEGCLTSNDRGFLKLAPAEWFRENAWALAIADCFHPNQKY